MRKLKICKFSLVLAKYASSWKVFQVLLFLVGLWRGSRWTGAGRVFLRKKQYVFGFKISQILCAVSWSAGFEQWRLF